MGAALSNAVFLCAEHHLEIDFPAVKAFSARRARERLIALHRAGAAEAKRLAIYARDRGDEAAASAARKLRREHLRQLARLRGAPGALTSWLD